MVNKIQIAGKLKFYSKPYGRQWKWRYQVHGHIYEPKLKIPKGLEGVKIIDPLHPETLPKVEKPKWTPEVRHPQLEFLFPKQTLQNHQNYNLTPIKLFDKTVKFHAGINQVCLLTKTKAIEGMPISITDSAKNMKIEDESVIVPNYIKQALAFNPTKKECTNYKPVNDIKFNIGKEFATPRTLQMEILLENLIRLCNININKKFPQSILRRNFIDRIPFYTRFTRGDEQIEIRRNHDFAIMSKDSLDPLADVDSIEKTSEFNFVDMYPIFPTIDLKEENVYDVSKPTLLGFRSENILSKNFLHTIFHINDDDFNNETDISRLIMFAFGSAYAQSQILKNNMSLELIEGTQKLNKPIVVKAVSILNDRLNFVAYQLNTLDLSDNKGIKNIVYIDTNNYLYLNRPNRNKIPYESHKNVQRYALSHLKYNPEAFQKLLSFISHGVK